MHAYFWFCLANFTIFTLQNQKYAKQLSNVEQSQEIMIVSLQNLIITTWYEASLLRRRFREVWEQRKTEERDFRCFSRAKNGASSRTIFRPGKTPKIPFLWLSLLPNPTETLATQANMKRNLATVDSLVCQVYGMTHSFLLFSVYLHVTFLRHSDIILLASIEQMFRGGPFDWQSALLGKH